MNIPTIGSLHKEKSTKNSDRQHIYTIVLDKCIEKIVYTNKFTDKTYTFFEIPQLLMGYPDYDMTGCILFIMEKLRHQKYYVEYFDSNSIYIDWGSNNGTPKQTLKSKTAKILQKFPNSKTVEYIYTENSKKHR
jgi:hypothetical protein